jgi:hypothetical protein
MKITSKTLTATWSYLTHCNTGYCVEKFMRLQEKMEGGFLPSMVFVMVE